MQGKVLSYGDNIDTDGIIPARYLNESDPAFLGAHCMEDVDKTFTARVRKGDILVAGENFGCGSSREHAPIALLAAGVGAVIAKSFARIFYRNAINIGLPILECPAAAEALSEGDEAEISLSEGTIRNLSTGEIYKAAAFPPFLMGIMEAGSLMEYVKKNKKSQSNIKNG